MRVFWSRGFEASSVSMLDEDLAQYLPAFTAFR